MVSSWLLLECVGVCTLKICADCPLATSTTEIGVPLVVDVELPLVLPLAAGVAVALAVGVAVALAVGAGVGVVAGCAAVCGGIFASAWRTASREGTLSNCTARIETFCPLKGALCWKLTCV